MASFNAGGMLQLMGGIRALFKCLYSTEIDKDFKSALWDMTGIKCLGDTFRQDYPTISSQYTQLQHLKSVRTAASSQVSTLRGL